MPIFIHQVSVAQVGDAGAADLAEPREGSRIRRLDPIADALERRAVNQMAEKHLAHEDRRPLRVEGRRFERDNGRRRDPARIC